MGPKQFFFLENKHAFLGGHYITVGSCPGGFLNDRQKKSKKLIIISWFWGRLLKARWETRKSNLKKTLKNRKTFFSKKKNRQFPRSHKLTKLKSRR